MDTYSTISGDTWDLICFKCYGNEWVMDTVMRANPHLIDISKFNAGTVIRLPDIDTTVLNKDLPPWVTP